MVELSEQAAQDRWKAKYFDALDAHERIEREAGVRVKELGALIARLSRTLPGEESAGLQKRLATLTEALKRKPLDGRLSGDVSDVHAGVLSMMELHDRERAHVMAALRHAATQLESFCADRKLKRGLKQFRASLGQKEPTPISELLDGFGDLQLRALDLASATRPGSSSPAPEHLPEPRAAQVPGIEDLAVGESESPAVHGPGAQNRAPTHDVALGEEAGVNQKAIDGAVAVDWPAVREVLAQLLTRLSVPAESKAQIEQLSARITHGLDENSLLSILEHLREMSDVSLTTLDLEFRGFLDSVEQRLDTVLSTLGQAHEQEQAALTREQGLADSFRARLDTMRDDAESATDLAVLKNSIDGHLDTLVRSMQDMSDEGRRASDERDSRLMAMTARLQELESESKQSRSQLETQRQLALTDSLTGLANRNALDERMAEEISRAFQHSSSLAIAIADIDHFKKVNDTYGHSAGDRALALFARILSTRVRATDFCARYGGEEFVMLFPGTTASMAAQVVEQVREFVESCGFSYKGEPVPLTASFGVTEYRRGDSAVTILERADQAMYEAKSSGRNRVCSAQA